MSQRYRVVVTDDRFGGTYDAERSVLASVEADLDIFGGGTDEELSVFCRTADALLVNQAKINDPFLGRLDRCRVLSRYGVGYDNVDVEAATRRGIWVARVPDYCREETAEQALGLLLDCVRGISLRDRLIRRGGWNLQRVTPVRRMTGKILGIVGFGNVGQVFRRLVSGFGFAEILVNDRSLSEDEAAEARVRRAGLGELLSRSDYVSLHVPLSVETRHLVDAAAIRRMKEGSVLVNTSRGAVVDEAALVEGLRSGRIAAAGLDVFETEPLPAASELLVLENVVLSDHFAYYSEESVAELRIKTARNAAEVLAARPPLYPVNAIERREPSFRQVQKKTKRESHEEEKKRGV